MLKNNEDPEIILDFLASDVDEGETLAVMIMRKNSPDFWILDTLKRLLKRGASPLKIIDLIALPSVYGWTVLHNAFYVPPDKLVDWLYFFLDILDQCKTDEEKMLCAEKIYEAMLSPAAYIYVNEPTRPIDNIKPGIGIFPIYRDNYFELVYELERCNVRKDKINVLLNLDGLEKEHKRLHPVLAVVRVILRAILPRGWFERLEGKYFLPDELSRYGLFRALKNQKPGTHAGMPGF